MSIHNSRFRILLSRTGLSKKILKLIASKDFEAQMQSIALVMGDASSPIYDVDWKPKFFVDLKAVPLDEILPLLERLDIPGYNQIPDTVEIQLSRFLISRRHGEKYSTVSLLIERGDINENSWQTPDECMLSLTRPFDYDYILNDNIIRPIFGYIIQILQPIFSFSHYPSEYDQLLNKPYTPPWKYYWETMIYGPDLVNTIGYDRLALTPAFWMIELIGPQIWLSSPVGLGSERDFLPDGDTPLRSERALFKREMRRYRRNVSKHLGLSEIR